MDANANNIEATFDVETVELSSEFDIEQQNFDALFSINAAGTTWGSIDGNIENQADLIAILNSKATNEALTALATTVTNNYTTLDTKIDGVQSDLSGDISWLEQAVNYNNIAVNNRIDTTNQTLANLSTTVASNNTAINNRVDSIVDSFDGDISVLETAIQNEAATRANNDTLLQNDINTLTSNLSAEISNRATADNTLQSNINSLSNTVTNNYTTLDGKITTINNTLSGYGNIVTHNVAEFATAAQGLLADTALQPNDNISELDNNVGYITSASLPTVNNNTITIQKNNTDIGSFTLNQSSNDTINITVPTDTQDLTNSAGFITSAALPTLSDLATNTQMAAIDSGATAEKIDQINTNTDDIFNETINRQLADNALQSQIDAIVASSDVFDIVGTYAELQAYDISTVPVNDIIKVLVDSTHSGAATYYRCVENNNVKSWSYIGSEGAYYTKGEADSKFVEQTITINGQPLSSNVTLTALDINALPSSTTIGAGVLTMQKNGTIINTFGANDTGNTTINITVPTDTSDLTNNAGFITSSDLTNYVDKTSDQNIAGTKNFAAISSSNIMNTSGTTILRSYAGDTEVGTTNTSLLLKSNLTRPYFNNTSTYLALLSDIPSEVTEATVTGWGFTKNTGTVTSVNDAQPDANGNVTLPIPSISNLADKDLSNLSSTGEAHFQAPLVSGTSIKTINNESILGSGNITIDSLPSQTGNSGKLLITNGSAASWTGIKTINSTSLLGSGDIAALQNTSDQNYSLTIEGTTNTQYGFAVNIGKGSAANGLYVTTIGALANGLEGAVAVGLNANGGNYGSVLGYRAGATGSYSVAIGANAKVSYVSGMGNPDYAIQLGYGTNSTPKTFAVGFGLDANNNEIEYEVLNGTTGLIPDARISTNIARTSDVATDLNGKADTDLSNVSSTGKISCADWGIPSATVELTYNSTNHSSMNGTTFTNTTGYPCYLFVEAQSNNANCTIYAKNISAGVYTSSMGNSGIVINAYIPVANGQQCQFYVYVPSGSVTWTATLHKMRGGL